MLEALLACTSPTGPSVELVESTSPADTGQQVAPSALVFADDRPTNLLVISLDTARRDLIGFFDDAGLTPNLTAIFSSGVVLEDHRSCSNWTVPSVLCAQTGRFPLDDEYWPSGMSESEADPAMPWPPPHPETLARLLTVAGYDTVLVTANHNFSSLMNGPASGFAVEDRQSWKNAEAVVDAALSHAQELRAGVPWYLHVHFVDPHGSYAAPEGWLPDPTLVCPWDFDDFEFYDLIWSEYDALDESEQAQVRECITNYYSAEIRYWDDQLGRLWAGLEAHDLLDDTLVVFWTDHGEQIGDHGRFQHGITPYDEEIRSTAAFWATDLEPLRWKGATIHQDLAPTILDALGAPPGRHTGEIVGRASEERVRIAFNHILGWDVPYFSAVRGDKKLVYWWDGTKRLFDLSTDPGEQIDIYAANDPELLMLWSALAPYLAQLSAWGLVPVEPGP